MIGAPVFRYVLTPGWAGDTLARAAQAVPSLDLNFAVTKNVGPLVSFTRASSATYVGSDKLLKTATTDEPRFDHNPTTGESLGLLVEEQRTNSLLRSEEFDHPGWSKANCTITGNATTGPSDALTADKLIPNVGVVTPYVIYSGTIPVTSGAAYTQSWFVKADGYRYVSAFELYSGTGAGGVVFDLQTGTVTGAGNGATTANGQIITLGNGWFRVSYSYTATSSGASPRMYVSGSGTSITSVTGNGTSGIFVWGAQLESGSFATSYIPTATAAVTRSADVASITTVGSNIRSLFAQFRSPASGTRPVASLDDNTANERIEILTSGTDPKLLVTDGGSAVADINGGTVTANATAKAAAVFDTNNYAFSVNGGASQLDSSGTLPTANRIRIGSNQAGGYLNGTIARAAGWDTALANLPPITQ
jgi:hypothetical protein